MKNVKPSVENFDIETLKLFVVLGVLTLAFVFGLRWTLFAPSPVLSESGAVIQADVSK